MKTEELRGMSDEELALNLRDTEKHLFQLRFQSSTDRLETPSEISKAKRNVARIKTIQRQRQLAALNKLPDADLAKQMTDLQGRVDQPGKRRVKRAIVRVAAIQAGRSAEKGSAK